ncbi:MAG TPA: hypothetical protein VMA97_10080 [Streptosporangiaceae bacterium]|nr:hypothetical protein [Streptosporangiaceae bacterium]
MGDSPPQYFPNPVSGGNYSQAFVQDGFGTIFAPAWWRCSRSASWRSPSANS